MDTDSGTFGIFAAVKRSAMESELQPTEKLAVTGESPATVGFLGLQFLNLTLAELADVLIADATHDVRRLVHFVNAHCVNVAAGDSEYRQLLHNDQALCADGIGMELAARLWGCRLRGNLNGSDVFPLVCERAAVAKVPIALLGARPGVAAECARKIIARYPELEVVWTEHGYLAREDEADRLRSLNASGARILFVAKGVPEQELWMREHEADLAVPVILGVGALFDFYSQTIRRAPLFMQRLRLEWLFRLLQEPVRLFHRYVIGNPEFILRAIWLRLSGG
jgi:exopolysaccharide biosynthesis WecB/TagA/CpsF family protein